MEQCQMEPALYGMITHVSPLKEPYTWHDLFTSFGLTTPPLNHEHLGWGYMESRPAYRTCPAYFNLGSLLAPTSFMYRIGEVIYDAMDAVDRVYHTDFRCQIGLTLAAAKSGVPLRPVNARYNFANDVHIEALFPEEQRNAVVIHYLREHQNIGRDAIFNDRVSMLKYLDREDLRLTNQTMQAELRRWFDAVDAEQGEVAPEFRW